METFNHPDFAGGPAGDHVVDWQLVATAGAARRDSAERDVRERISRLEAEAMTLVRSAVTTPATAAVQRSLAALDAEIRSLRAELAWHRAAAC